MKLGADTTSCQGSHNHKIVRTTDAIRCMESAFEADQCLNVILPAEEINCRSVFRILKDDLDLVKKSAVELG